MARKRDKREPSARLLYVPSDATMQKNLNLRIDAQLFALGRAQYYRGDCSGAARNFRALLTGHPKSRLADDATYWLGTCYRLQNQPAQAAVTIYSNPNPKWHDAQTVSLLVQTARNSKNLYVGTKLARDMPEQQLRTVLQARAVLLMAVEGSTATVAGDGNSDMMKALRKLHSVKFTTNTVTGPRVAIVQAMLEAQKSGD